MSDVLIDRTGKCGYLTLNRPDTLNALTYSMVLELHDGLRRLEQDDKVEIIVVRSASEKAFCAGGDMKATRLQAIAGEWDDLYAFFKDEYALNLDIANCRKPYISLIHGFAMGGGLGISVHGTARVVSEKAVMAMPETAIGFIPDVGGTYFLSRLPMDAGLWWGLSGMPISAEQTVALGLATHLVPHGRWAEMCESLESGGVASYADVLCGFSEPVDTDKFDALFRRRALWFDADSNQQVFENLARAASQSADATSAKDAGKLLQKFKQASPYAMDLTRNLLKQAVKLDLADCLQLELDAGRDAVRHPDFVEGIRAVLVDKDRKPQWETE